MFEIDAGFMPLTDSAILVIAKELGFAEQQNIALRLVRETSWANIRDRMAFEQLEISHCLAPMPISSNMGIGPFSVDLIAPMALGMGGNAVSVSSEVFENMVKAGEIDPSDASSTGDTLAKVVEAHNQSGKKPLQFGVVHPFSAHNFELRYWLSSIGVKPDVDVDMIIVPPPLMADALKSGQIDGFCVGEPWNSVAVEKGAGHIITIKSAIWASSPEKVLAVNSKWAKHNGELLTKLLIALVNAARWCSKKDNKVQLAQILSQSQYLNMSDARILPGLDGSILSQEHPNPKISHVFMEQYENAATFPWQSHAMWLYTQMVRWGQIEHSAENAKIARDCFRPDIYRAALSLTDAVVPAANSKVEGALTRPTAVGVGKGDLYLGPDGFFDGKIFDPDQIDEYIESQLSAD